MNSSNDPSSRQQQDRRKKPTSVWDSLRGRGRRVQNRRAGDRAKPYFVDRFPLTTFLLVLMLLCLTLADGLVTLYLTDANCQEVNPVMGYLLHKGPVQFLIGKYILTVAGIPILLVFKNFNLFGTDIRVGHLIPAFAVLYLLLILYQLHLLYVLGVT
jgi:Domain of unknown function (DUF5658)